MIICITGLPAAGKGETAEILRRMGFKVYGLGALIREKMVEERIAVTPESDKSFTVYLKKKYGKNIAAKLLFHKLKHGRHGNLAIEGIRNKAELDYIRKRMGKIVVIAVVAPVKTRFERSKMRHRPDAPKTLQAFIKNKDKKEEGFGLMGAIWAADYVIANTGTKVDLRRSVERVVQSL